MAVVIRLQGLNIAAGSEDIRNFFTGLRIPDGGVHIIGGELGEAFIIFASDEDARRAMTRSGGCIKDFQVKLLLSSRSEMQKVLEDSTRRSEANRRNYKEIVKRPAFEGRPTSLNEGLKLAMQRGDKPKMGNRPSVMSSNDSRNKKKGGDEGGHYVYLSGMPFTAKKEDVAIFFDGLDIDDLIFMRNKNGGFFNGCGLVKFRNKEDVIEALKRDRKYIGSRYIRVLPATENQWVRSGGSAKLEAAGPRKSHTRSRSPVRHRSRSPSGEEFGVLYENLPYSVEKRNVKALLQPVLLTDNQISIFVDPSGSRRKSAIVMFRNLKDYCSGLAHHEKTLMHNVVHVSPISKEKADKILACTHDPREDRRRSSRSSELSPKSFCDAERRCIYVRNLPFDVRKVEIMDFFLGFQLSEDRVILLRDDHGAGLGEALLIFPTEKEAGMAQSLNGQRFLGSEVMLKCITWAQMQEFGVDTSSIMSEGNVQRNSPGYSSEPNFLNDRMYQDSCDMMSDSPRRGPGNRGVLDRFENPDDFVQESRDSGPRQYGPAEQQFNRPTCVKLLNLPSKIRVDEIYDFCYGYRVIPGSVSLEYSRSGVPTGSATVVFENHGEALNAVQELNGRPIGTRKINIVFV